MNGRVQCSRDIASVTEKSKDNAGVAPHGTTNGRHNSTAPSVHTIESGAGDVCGDIAARLRNARDAARRTCRNIYARYDWVRLDESLSREIESFEALPGAPQYRAVFEAKEPADGVVEALVWSG